MARRARSYLGLGVSGFPNLFLVNGPSASVFGNVPLLSEHCVDWIGDCIDWLHRSELTSIEPLHAAQDAWMEEVLAMGERSLFMKTNSWFTGGNIPGKKRGILAFLGGFNVYGARCRDVAQKSYEGFLARP